MRANNVLGILFSNAYETVISELTDARTMGSVPFCGRYRLIDFALSNLVNSGIGKVGVITKSNYQSLMDHLGTGKSWDLSRKREGMFILPPFNSAQYGVYRDRIQALSGVMQFIHQSNEEYVLLTDCNVVCNFDVSDLLDFHMESGADITIAYKHGKQPKLDDLLTMELSDTGRVSQVLLSPNEVGECNYSLNIYIMRKSLLERLVNNAYSMNKTGFERDIIQQNVDKLNIFGYAVPGFVGTIDSLQSYYQLSMSLLDHQTCTQLFPAERPVYTKVRDDMPVIYGLGCSVQNSLIADGCVIDGEVENCILFRGVTIAKGAKVKNSIIMQGSYISENASLDCVIMDKSVVVKPNMSLLGAPTYPVYVGKGLVI